jgi:hypothetical protein
LPVQIGIETPFREIDRIKQGGHDAALVENIKKAMIRATNQNESNSSKSEY